MSQDFYTARTDQHTVVSWKNVGR